MTTRRTKVPQLTDHEREILLASITEMATAGQKLESAQKEFEAVRGKPSVMLMTILKLKGEDPDAWMLNYSLETKEVTLVRANQRPV